VKARAVAYAEPPNPGYNQRAGTRREKGKDGMTDQPSYAREEVTYWENSAIDSRIYLVEPTYPVIPRNPGKDAGDQDAAPGPAETGS
jgi:hypothetical protein